jgi:hypothetical protein
METLQHAIMEERGKARAPEREDGSWSGVVYI